MEKIKQQLIEKKEFILSIIDIVMEEKTIAYFKGQLVLIESILNELED